MDQQIDESCVFCRIVRGDFGTQFVAQNELAVAFRDIEPKAPTHVLVVPRRHVRALQEAGESDGDMLAALLLLATEVARREGLLASGYRVVINDGPDAGQSVDHLHLHVMGGKRLNLGLG